MSTRVLLADDHQVLRKGLRSLLEAEPSLEVVGEASDGQEAAALAVELAPDLVLMDSSMPILNGAMATRKILSTHPEIKVIALSMHPDHRHVSEMLRAGASAYVLKTCDIEELLHAIEVVRSDRKYVSPEITSEMVGYYLRGVEAASGRPSGELTGREREVLQLLAEGRSSKEIARLLHVSVKTVGTHRQNIMDKLGVRSVAELTKYAIREGLTSL